MRSTPSLVRGWVLSTALVLSLLLASTPEISTVRADILCTQFGFDTFQIGSTVEFEWSDTQSYPIGNFNLDLYCFENSKLLGTLATIDTATAISPQKWTVDSSILQYKNDCPLNQYYGAFDWTMIDPTTGTATRTGSKCKAVLLNGPGVVPPPGTVDQPTEEDDSKDHGEVTITDRTKKIIIGVGCAVGVLILAGFVAFYYIRVKNKRAEQDLANKKLREPLHSTNHDNHHNGSDRAASTVVEMTSVMSQDMRLPAMEQERPVSVLTSSFSPAEDEEEREKKQRLKLRQQQEEQQVYEQQLHQQQQQQLMLQQQQQQMQQQQQTYGGYNGY
ncbi:hypothetical protein BGZ94_006268 [Podila epigama]|nr:hypothetical protein BGZ94_006268 [Podila epigama]